MHVSVRRRLEPAQSLQYAPAAPLAAACSPLTLLLRRPPVQVCERCRPGGCPYWRQRTRRGTRGKRSGGLARSSNGRRRATKVSSGPRNPSVVASGCAGAPVRAARGLCAVRVLRGSAALRARGVARSTCFTVIISNVCQKAYHPWYRSKTRCPTRPTFRRGLPRAVPAAQLRSGEISSASTLEPGRNPVQNSAGATRGQSRAVGESGGGRAAAPATYAHDDSGRARGPRTPARPPAEK